MACPRCRCRLLSAAPADQGKLICSNCAYPMSDFLRIQQARFPWRQAAMIISLAIATTGLILIKSTANQDKDLLDQSSAEKPRRDNI